MVKIAFLSALDIKCDFPYLISEDTAEKRVKILQSNRINPSVTVEYFKGHFYLTNSFANHAAYLSAQRNSLIFCVLLEAVGSDEKERLLRVLRNASLERAVPWKLLYTIIIKLHREYQMDVQSIAKDTGIIISKVKKYILDESIPDKYKRLAITRGKGGPILNRICRDPKLTPVLREILYELTFNDFKKFTDKEYALLNTYRKKLYYLTEDPYTLKDQLLEIFFPKEFIENVYWKDISNKYLNYPQEFETKHFHELQ